MLNFLATIWFIIGIIVGVAILFLLIVGITAMIDEAVKKHDFMKKYGRK